MQNMQYRFTNLDCLKIIATILVIFHHYQQVFDVKFSGINFYGGSFYIGRFVELFFIISGFVCCYRKDADSEEILRPVVKKVLRIYLCTALALTFLLLVMVVYKLNFGLELSSQPCTIPRAICSYLLIFSGWGINIGLGLNNPTWYLCILILCYILFYVIYKIFFRFYALKIGFLVGLIGVCLVFEQFGFLSNAPFIGTHNVRGYSCFFIGVIICEASRLIINKRIKILFSLFLVSFYIVISLEIGYNHWQTLDVLLFPGIVMLFVEIKQINCKTINKWAKISFQAYLWHVPLIKFFILIFTACGVEGNHSYISMIIFVIIIMLYSSLIYKYYELTIFNKLKIKFDL